MLIESSALHGAFSLRMHEGAPYPAARFVSCGRPRGVCFKLMTTQPAAALIQIFDIPRSRHLDGGCVHCNDGILIASGQRVCKALGDSNPTANCELLITAPAQHLYYRPISLKRL
eukprot:scaffold24612_cov31-Tisochrysis_lutea.AAC.3